MTQIVEQQNTIQAALLDMAKAAGFTEEEFHTIQAALEKGATLADVFNISKDTLESGYAYIVTPVSASLTAWGDAGVKVGDITENGKMPFTCTDTPTSAISVNILRAEVSQ